MRKILFILLLLFNQSLSAGSFDWQSISVSDALHALARQFHQSIVIHSRVTGSVSLHLHNMTPMQAFDFILQSQGLTRYTKAGVWFVVPRDVLLQQKQEEWKQREMLDAAAPLLTQVWQIRYANAQDIVHMIQDNTHSLLTKRGYVQVDARTNQIYVRDIAENLLLVARLIKRMDIPVKQIVIEARLASVDSDFERELGIHFSTENKLAPGHYSLAVAALADGSLLDMQLVALEHKGRGELISSPSLFTANQQTAIIESGEEIPYQEISRSGATGVAFKKAVLSLKVTPQILPDHRVQLQLQVNQDRPSARMVLGVPAITTRQINSSIVATSGHTIVLGGIFETNRDELQERIPFLGSIPVLGALFTERNRTENKRELLIFITPKIIG